MLEGSLSEFSFAEILELAGKNKKTGVILIKKPDGAEAQVYLKDGYIYFAESNLKKKPIGEMLVESGKISRNQLQDALEEQKRMGKKVRLGMILLDKGYISPKDLVQVVQEQILDSIFQLFDWTEGTFVFIPGKVAENEDIGIKLDVETAILRGAEKISYWKSVRDIVGDLDTSYEPSEVSDDDRVIVLKPKELKVLRYIDGEKKIRDLLKLLGMPETELYQILFALSSSGLIKKKEEKSG